MPRRALAGSDARLRTGCRRPWRLVLPAALAGMLLILPPGPVHAAQKARALSRVAATATAAPRAAAQRLRDRQYRAAHEYVVLQRLSPLQRAQRLAAVPSPARAIGFPRELPLAVSDAPLGDTLSWRVLENGGLAGTLQLASSDASALRLGLLARELPPSVTLSFYAPGAAAADTTTVTGAQVNAQLAASARRGEQSSAARTFWSPLVEGDTLALEVYLPPGIRPGQLALRPRLLSHLVYSPGSGARDLLMPRIGEAQDCSLNAVCPDTWASVRDSVARVSYVDSGGGSFLCTGTLLNDTAGSGTPYFLTAHHCIDSQAEASSMSLFWFYEASACGSGALSARATQRGGGAVLLYSSVNTDATLVLLNSMPPAGAVYAGWSAEAPQLQASVTVIHHPRGDLKKISEGFIDSFQSCREAGAGFSCSFRSANASDADFVDVQFSVGTSESGSSGSPIFSDDEQLLMGTLWGGSSSCSNPTGTNAFGRFDRSFEQGQLAQWLDATVYYQLSISRGGSGDGAVVSTPPAIDCGSSCSAGFPAGSTVTLIATPGPNSRFTGWGGACTGTEPCVLTLNGDSAVSADFTLLDPPGLLRLSPPALEFVPQSLSTRSLPLALALTNVGDGPLQVQGFEVAPPFVIGASDCATPPLTLQPGQQCSLQVQYLPTVEGIIEAILSVQTAAGESAVDLRGAGEASLVTHYYGAILGRIPDPSGKLFWDGEYQRMQDLGADLNEVWYTMALNFFSSDEYRDASRGDAEFLADLYRTFFNREPDDGGLAFWLGQLHSGMPRDAVLLSFLFSGEFSAFTAALFGATGAAPDLNAVMDLYRGLLGRLPDDEGLGFWLGAYRDAQCAADDAAPAVAAVAADTTRLFADSPEYLARARSDEDYVVDLYNAILRRGGDLEGVLFWIDALRLGRQSRDEVRRAFLNSAEFQDRVQAIVDSAAPVCGA